MFSLLWRPITSYHVTHKMEIAWHLSFFKSLSYKELISTESLLVTRPQQTCVSSEDVQCTFRLGPHVRWVFRNVIWTKSEPSMRIFFCDKVFTKYGRHTEIFFTACSSRITIKVWWSIKYALKTWKKKSLPVSRRFKKASWAVPGNKYLFALRFVLIFILFVYCLTSCKSISLTIYIQRFEDIATDLFVLVAGDVKISCFYTQKS